MIIGFVVKLNWPIAEGALNCCTGFCSLAGFENVNWETTVGLVYSEACTLKVNGYCFGLLASSVLAACCTAANESCGTDAIGFIIGVFEHSLCLRGLFGISSFAMIAGVSLSGDAFSAPERLVKS